MPFDTAQLIEETLNSMLYPNPTSPNRLRVIVLPPSLLLTVTGVAGLGNTGYADITPFSSSIRWRKTGLRYHNNEIYFDVTEELKAVVGSCVHFTSPITATGSDLESLTQNGDAFLRCVWDDRF